MVSQTKSTLLVIGLFCIGTSFSSGQKAPNAAAPDPVSEAAVQVIEARCLGCHNSALKSGGIILSDQASALATGAFLPGKPDASKLIRMVQTGKMPPTGKLPDAEINSLVRWVAAGGSWPAGGNGLGTKGLFWSLQPILHPAIPHSPFDALSASPIDRFLFRRLAAKGLQPSPLAGKRELLRRVTVDLTGLPPTSEAIRAFLLDRDPKAYEKVVDQLLASPAYGERWGRHWLDVVRFGESNGYEQNHLRPNAWPYRDYVIRAFNEDKPYPQFIAEQLAGDVLSNQDPSCAAATGFLVAGVHDTVGIQEEVGTRQQRSNDLDDIVSTTGATFLGLTVGCAKCHDHKFDPIPQKDYYRFTACFAGVQHGERSLASPEQLKSVAEKEAESTRRILLLSDQINAAMAEGREKVQHPDGAPAGSRPAVNARWNVDEFPAVTARFVRFTVLATNDGTEP